MFLRSFPFMMVVCLSFFMTMSVLDVTMFLICMKQGMKLLATGKESCNEDIGRHPECDD